MKRCPHCGTEVPEMPRLPLSVVAFYAFIAGILASGWIDGGFHIL